MSDTKCSSSNIPASPEPREPACRLVAASTHVHDEQLPPTLRIVRSMGRPDTLTAQRVEVGIVLHAMLGMSAATDYFAKHPIREDVVRRVLSPAGPRRGNHDANGVRT